MIEPAFYDDLWAQSPERGDTRSASTPTHDAENLTNGGRRAVIRLNDQNYTLQITKQGKLLLTK